MSFPLDPLIASSFSIASLSSATTTFLFEFPDAFNALNVNTLNLINKPTWSSCYYFVWHCGFYFLGFHVVLPCSLFSCAWGRESWCMHFSCICLFILHAFCPFSLPIGVRGWLRVVILATPWTFLLTLKKTNTVQISYQLMLLCLCSCRCFSFNL